MAIRIFNAVWEHGPDDRNQMLVLMVLADYADGDTGECWPSVGTIAARSRMSVTVARRTLGALERGEWIRRRPDERRNGAQTANRYTVCFEKLGLVPRVGARPSARGGQNDRPPGQNDRPPRSERPPLGPGQNDRGIYEPSGLTARWSTALFERYRAEAKPLETVEDWLERLRSAEKRVEGRSDDPEGADTGKTSTAPQRPATGRDGAKKGARK